LREGARGRGNLKGELFTLTLTLSRQGRGNYFKISKSGFGRGKRFVIFKPVWYISSNYRKKGVFEW
jgi:hypothetical protein